MKSIFDKITERLLSFFGLDLDLTLDMAGQPFHRITDTLYLGSRPDPQAVSTLKEAGITHVVSCLSASDRQKVAFLQRDFRAQFLAVNDGIHEDIASTFPEFFDFALSARKEPSARLLVHCEAGVSRSATLVTALLMKTEGLRFFEVFGRVREQRAHVLPNIGFASQLQRFEHERHPESRVDGALSSLARYLCEICNAPVDAGLLQTMLERNDYDAFKALQAIFGEEIPRVVQGVRL